VVLYHDRTSGPPRQVHSLVHYPRLYLPDFETWQVSTLSQLKLMVTVALIGFPSFLKFGLLDPISLIPECGTNHAVAEVHHQGWPHVSLAGKILLFHFVKFVRPFGVWLCIGYGTCTWYYEAKSPLCAVTYENFRRFLGVWHVTIWIEWNGTVCLAGTLDMRLEVRNFPFTLEQSSEIGQPGMEKESAPPLSLQLILRKLVTPCRFGTFEVFFVTWDSRPQIFVTWTSRL
jgi:hypothetical protein